ncbi:MAG: hypothetical protein WCV63_09345 [Negativicutes bacterium]|jgi:hypothetical protein
MKKTCLWKCYSREERQFVSELYCWLKFEDNLKEFCSLIGMKNFQKNDLEVNFEVALFRDIKWNNDIEKNISGYFQENKAKEEFAKYCRETDDNVLPKSFKKALKKRVFDLVIFDHNESDPVMYIIEVKAQTEMMFDSADRFIDLIPLVTKYSYKKIALLPKSKCKNGWKIITWSELAVIAEKTEKEETGVKFSWWFRRAEKIYKAKYCGNGTIERAQL